MKYTRAQMMFHLWRTNTSLVQRVIPEYFKRSGATRTPPPADIPQRVLVISKFGHALGVRTVITPLLMRLQPVLRRVQHLLPCLESQTRNYQAITPSRARADVMHRCRPPAQNPVHHRQLHA